MARPASFDREQVLEIALNAFWDTGFSNTGIAALVERMGLKPSSLYGAFSSKEGLFMEVLQRYSAQSLAQIEQILGSAASPLAGVQALLDAVARDAIASEAHRGCLLVNTLLEIYRHHPLIQETASSHLAEVELRVSAALCQAQAAGAGRRARRRRHRRLADDHGVGIARAGPHPSARRQGERGTGPDAGHSVCGRMTTAHQAAEFTRFPAASA